MATAHTLSRPLIGISGRRWPASRLGDWTVPAMHPAEFDLHFSDYADAIADAGGIPVQVPQIGDPGDVIARLDGFVLSGGADVDPSRYGHAPEPELGAIEERRDAYEFAALAAALELGVPTLAICRGFQIVNVHFGGTLVQHVERDDGDGHPRFAEDRGAEAHGVSCTVGSLAERVLGEHSTVNSLHHQVVGEVGDGLVATATSPDGSVEVLEHAGHPDLLAVQWHPEMMRRPDPCIAWIVERAASFAASGVRA